MGSKSCFAICVLLFVATTTNSTPISDKKPGQDVVNVLSTSTRQDGRGSCQGGDQYACVDWSFGSTKMSNAQAAYKPETFFVVGSYGSSENMGKCYEFKKSGSTWTFVGQVINYGSDVNNGQFDIQVGAGGFGIYNACTKRSTDPDTTESGSLPLFPGEASDFGERYGGAQNLEACSRLPLFPAGGTPPAGEVSLQALCRRSFSWGARDGNILSLKRIACPPELYQITRLRRADDDSFTWNEEVTNFGFTTTMMDCCKPAGSAPSLVPNPDQSYPFAHACKRDGYTRV